MPVSLCVLSAIVCIPGEIKLQLNNIFTRCCWTDSDARRPALRAPLSNYSSPGWVDRFKPGCPPGYPGVAHLHIACALSSLLYWWTHTPQDCRGVLFCWLKKTQRGISEVRRTFVDVGLCSYFLFKLFKFIHLFVYVWLFMPVIWYVWLEFSCLISDLFFLRLQKNKLLTTTWPWCYLQPTPPIISSDTKS